MDMENIVNEYSCGRADDIIAYIYNEMKPSEREKFENHLADCMNCTDEFAVVSDARFSVFEWHKEEFSNLQTPEFSIPDARANQASPRFFDAVLSIFRGAGWAVPAAAVVVLCIMLAGLFLSMRDTKDEAAITGENREKVAANDMVSKTGPGEIVSSASDDVLEPVKAGEPTVAEGSKPQPAAARNIRRAPSKPRSHGNLKMVPRQADKPVLSSYDEVEDKSLRLADLLDGVGG